MSRAFVAVCVILAACVAAFWPSFEVLLRYWNDTHAMGMTHGWLIAAIVAWLLWRTRGLEGRGASCWPCLAAMLVLWFGWLVALRAGLQIVHLALLPPIAWLAIAGAMGTGTARRFTYPLGYFYFAIPLWGNLTPALQWLTVYAVRFMLRATGVPAYFQGNVVQIPSGHFEIVGGCSGLHYFLVSLAVASLYSHIHRDPPRRHLVIVAIAGVAAILLNWVRVYAVIVSGHLTDMQSFLVRVDHYWFGWLLFGVAMTVALRIAGRVLPAAEPVPAQTASAQPAARLPWAGVATMIGVLAVLGLSVRVAGREVSAATAPDVAGPLLAAGFLQTDDKPAPGTDIDDSVPGTFFWQPKFKGTTQEFHGTTADGAMPVFVGVYASQRQGAELGYYRNSITGPLLSEIASGNRDGVAWTTAEDRQENRWLIGSVYSVGGRAFADPTLAQVYYALRSIGGAVPSAVIGVAARCNTDCAGREAELTEALQQVRAPVSQALTARTP